METRTRTIIKALTWRVIATLTTTTIALLMTQKVNFALTIGFIDTCIKLAIYYFHERIWNNVKFGRLNPPEYEI